MDTTHVSNQRLEVAFRIREMRGICGFTEAEMARRTDTTPEEYRAYEGGMADLPFTFIHKCSLAFGIGITDLLEGHSANPSSYTVTRRGEGQQTAKEPGIEIANLAPLFRNKLAEPYYCTYDYDEAQQRMPIHLTTHSGQEFDIVLSGQLKVQVGEHTEILGEGDSILYNSSTPHGMIAVGGGKCVFCAVVISGEKTDEKAVRQSIVQARSSEDYVCKRFFDAREDERGVLQSLTFPHADQFNFAFDCVDAIAAKYPEKLAMLHLDRDKNERGLTFSGPAEAELQVLISALEDILEELVGEIWDEHDEVIEIFRKQPDGSYISACSADLDDMYDLFQVTGECDAATVSGWVLEQLGRVPEPGDHFAWQDLDVTVTRAEHHRVLEIRVVVLPPAEEEAET